MSATTGTIGAEKSLRPFELYWLAALVLASLVAVLGIGALVGGDAGPAPAVRPQASTVSVEAPPGFRYANGEVYPRPFVSIQEGVTVNQAEAPSGLRYGPDGEAYPRPLVATGTT